jgi:hypothetical protein
LLIEGRLLGDYTPVEDGVGLSLTLDLTSIGIGAYSLGSCPGQGILSVVLSYDVKVSLLGLKNNDMFERSLTCFTRLSGITSFACLTGLLPLFCA